MNRLAKQFMFLTPDGMLLSGVTDSWDKCQKPLPAYVLFLNFIFFLAWILIFFFYI